MNDEMASGVQKARAVLFDMHNTISHHRANLNEATRDTSKSVGLDIDHCTDQDLHRAIMKAEGWLRQHQIENDVSPDWGGEPEDWTEANRIMFSELGIKNVSEDILVEMETRWKKLVNSPDFEVLAEDSKHTVSELHARGYTLGVCTRRYDNPADLLSHWGIDHMLSTVQYTGVPGYAKPSPYTLLKAAEDIELNPRLCMYVGNYVNVDVQAALRAEMIPVLLTWANPEEAEKVPPETIVLNSPRGLLDILPQRS